MAETYELRGCEHDIKAFILKNFVTVAQNEAFKEISVDLLTELLSADKLQAESELDVFQVGWGKILEINSIKFFNFICLNPNVVIVFILFQIYVLLLP